MCVVAGVVHHVQHFVVRRGAVLAGFKLDDVREQLTVFLDQVVEAFQQSGAVFHWLRGPQRLRAAGELERLVHVGGGADTDPAKLTVEERGGDRFTLACVQGAGRRVGGEFLQPVEEVRGERLFFQAGDSHEVSVTMVEREEHPSTGGACEVEGQGLRSWGG